MKITKIFNAFIESEKAGGIILILCTVFSMILVNSPLQNSYLNIWHFQIAGESFSHWINDGLMAIFFLLIGLELEREIYDGELSDFKKALLPVFAAVGGIIVPASIFMIFNYGTPTQSGAGIPMATDIAFALGILSLLGNRISLSLKIFLTALAVIDDIGAIIVIGIFYTNTVIVLNLIIAFSIFGVLLILNRLKVYILFPYLILGIFMWYFMLKSGVHASIAGVLLGFAIPFGKGDEKSPSIVLQQILHKPVAFIILPLFALANTCVIIDNITASNFYETSSLGILCGLILGKPIGIVLFSFISVMVGWCTLPEGTNWRQIIGIGILGGIGFTMSIFITHLAFNDEEHINNAKFMIIIGSTFSAILGYFWLKFSTTENDKLI